MAPKKRRKIGLTRMDAALDQMSSYGFSKQLVRKTVNHLLKLYSNDGWKLIEEDGYRVLLDVILDEQETAQTQNLLKDASSQQENTENKLVIADLKTEDKLPILAIEGPENQECWKDIALEETAQRSPIHTGDHHSADKVNLKYSEDPLLSASATDKAHAPPNVCVHRRKPCYGWISDDDDDDEETSFIALTPAS